MPVRQAGMLTGHCTETLWSAQLIDTSADTDALTRIS